jgi:hypothetical protein
MNFCEQLVEDCCDRNFLIGFCIQRRKKFDAIFQDYQNDPTNLLSQELAKAYNGVNMLCVVVARKYCSKEDSLNMDQPFTLYREELELDIAKEEWGDSEEKTLEKPYVVVEEVDQDNFRDDDVGILEDSKDFCVDFSDGDDVFVVSEEKNSELEERGIGPQLIVDDDVCILEDSKDLCVDFSDGDDVSVVSEEKNYELEERGIGPQLIVDAQGNFNDNATQSSCNTGDISVSGKDGHHSDDFVGYPIGEYIEEPKEEMFERGSLFATQRKMEGQYNTTLDMYMDLYIYPGQSSGRLYTVNFEGFPKFNDEEKQEDVPSMEENHHSF